MNEKRGRPRVSKVQTVRAEGDQIIFCDICMYLNSSDDLISDLMIRCSLNIIHLIVLLARQVYLLQHQIQA